MAVRVTRRGFLGGALGLLAAQPSFSAPQGTVRPEVFPVTLRKKPPHEKLRQYIAPGSDAFASEVRAAELVGALKRTIETGAPPPLAAGFAGRSPMPSNWKDLSEDAAVAEFDPEDRGFGSGIAEWLEGLDSVRFYPLENGLVRFEARRGDGYHVGHWRVAWNNAVLESFEPVDETRTTLSGVFERAVFLDPDDPAADQLSTGVDQWRRRLDLTCGIDIYGQNGIAVGDIDNDGFDEIYACQPGGLPNRLLKRGDDGFYRDVSVKAGVDLLDHTSCALFADFRNAGVQDLVVLTGSQPVYFENQGGVFEQKNGKFRFAEPPRGAFTGMAAADYDGDGFLDLYICTYIYFQSEDQYSYPAPYHDARNGPPNFLFRNRLADGGFFEDVTAQVGLDENNDRYSFAPAWCDYDFDGRPELYVANDFGRNNLYKFDGERFRDIAAEAGVEDLGPGMSAAWFDAHGAGRPDLYVTNMWTASGRRVVNDPAFELVAEKGLREQYRHHTKGNSLYRNRGDGTFEETGEAEMGRWSWTGDARDFDCDGKPEIVVAAGMISEPDRAKPDLMSFFWRQVVAHSGPDATPSPKYEEGWNAINQLIREGYSWNGHEPSVLYKRRGGVWVDFSPELTEQPLDTRAFAALDLDGDGRLDLVLKNRLGPQLLPLLNQSTGANVMVLELEGTKSNRDAIGAWVTAESDSGVTAQLVSAGSGYLCQHTKRVHLGLGETKVAKQVIIRWPGGEVETLPELAAGKRYRIVEGRGVVESRRLEARRRPAPKPWSDRLLIPTGFWLIEPVPLPERLDGPALVIVDKGATGAPSSDLPVLRIDVETEPDRAAWYAIFQRYLLDYRGPLTVPMAVLIDGESRAHKVYGLVPDAEALRRDAAAMNDPDRVALALPFPGRYAGGVPNRNYFRHGAAFYQAGYLEQALPYLETVLERAPDNFKARLAMGRIHLDAGRAKEARTHVEEAVRLKPDSPEAWNDMGGLAMAEEDYATAARHFDKALELAPNSSYALPNAAQAAARLGETGKAESLFRRTLEIAPDDADATNQLGLLYAKQERFDEAKELFQRAIELDRGHVAAINNLAVLYLRLNKPSEAIAALRYGIRAAPEAEESYMNLARVYVQSGDLAQARAVIEQLLDKDPENATARRAIEELNRR